MPPSRERIDSRVLFRFAPHVGHSVYGGKQSEIETKQKTGGKSARAKVGKTSARAHAQTGETRYASGKNRETRESRAAAARKIVRASERTATEKSRNETRAAGETTAGRCGETETSAAHRSRDVARAGEWQIYRYCPSAFSLALGRWRDALPSRVERQAGSIGQLCGNVRIYRSRCAGRKTASHWRAVLLARARRQRSRLGPLVIHRVVSRDGRNRIVLASSSLKQSRVQCTARLLCFF